MCGGLGNNDQNLHRFEDNHHLDKTEDFLDRLDYNHLSKTEEFIGHLYGYFKRKYAPKVDLSEAEAQVINSLQDCYLDLLMTNESRIDEKFLKDKEEAIITSKIRESLGVEKAEDLQYDEEEVSPNKKESNRRTEY